MAWTAWLIQLEMFRVTVLLLGLLLTAARAQSVEQDTRAFGARLDQLRTEHRLPGLSAAIVRNQEL